MRVDFTPILDDREWSKVFAEILSLVMLHGQAMKAYIEKGTPVPESSLTGVVGGMWDKEPFRTSDFNRGMLTAMILCTAVGSEDIEKVRPQLVRLANFLAKMQDDAGDPKALLN